MLGLLLALVSAGCTKQAERAHHDASTKQPATAPSQWQFGVHKDPMTDDVTYAITALDEIHDGALTIACYPKANVYVVSLPHNFYNDGFHDIEYRFDSERPSTALARYSGNDAIIGAPMWPNEALKRSNDVFMTSLNGWQLDVEIKHKAHKALKVRATSFNGDSVFLEFNTSSVQNAIRDMEAKCHRSG